MGLDLLRIKNSPRLSLLGLKGRPFRTILDVGANIGQFARQMRQLFPAAQIHSFEPLPEAFAALDQWAATQNGKVSVYNLAIGNETSEIYMHLHKDHSPSSSILTTTELAHELYPFTSAKSQICVQQTTLDAVLGNQCDDFQPDLLIKLDVQGFEDRVIDGGSKVMAKASACILEVSLDTLYDGQAEFHKLVNQLHSLGLRYVGNLHQTYADDGHCIFLDAVFQRDSVPPQAIHSERA